MGSNSSVASLPCECCVSFGKVPREFGSTYSILEDDFLTSRVLYYQRRISQVQWHKNIKDPHQEETRSHHRLFPIKMVNFVLYLGYDNTYVNNDPARISTAVLSNFAAL